MDYSRSQTPVIPKNVEDGVNKFRVGEDFALAHRLQGKLTADGIRYIREFDLRYSGRQKTDTLL